MLENILSLCHLGITYFDVVPCSHLRLEISGVWFRCYRFKRGRTGCCGCRTSGDNRGEWVDCRGALSCGSRISTVLLEESHEAGNVKREEIRHTTKE